MLESLELPITLLARKAADILSYSIDKSSQDFEIVSDLMKILTRVIFQSFE